MRRAGPPERFAAREVGLVLLAGVALGIAATWPLVLHLGSRVASDPGDPLLQAWQVAWDGHAIVHQPLHFFQANSFWPLRDSLAFSDALIGYTPAGLIGSGPTAAVVRYDLLFVGAIALAFGATYLLARELGAGRVAAACGGLAFAYAPWRLGQAGHLHVLSAGGIALSLLLLVRGYRRRSAAQIVAGWVVAAWQVSIGFTLGLQLLYLLLAIGVVLLVGWLRRRPALDRAAIAPTAVGLVVLVATSVVLARPYLRVLHDHPESHRTIARVAKLSPPPESRGCSRGPAAGRAACWSGECSQRRSPWRDSARSPPRRCRTLRPRSSSPGRRSSSCRARPGTTRSTSSGRPPGSRASSTASAVSRRAACSPCVKRPSPSPIGGPSRCSGEWASGRSSSTAASPRGLPGASPRPGLSPGWALPAVRSAKRCSSACRPEPRRPDRPSSRAPRAGPPPGAAGAR